MLGGQKRRIILRVSRLLRRIPSLYSRLSFFKLRTWVQFLPYRMREKFKKIVAYIFRSWEFTSGVLFNCLLSNKKNTKKFCK